MGVDKENLLLIVMGVERYILTSSNYGVLQKLSENVGLAL